MANGERHAVFEAFLLVIIRLCAQLGLRRKLTKRSSQKDAMKAYKALLLKVHPDKGGKPEDFKELQAAKDAFDAAGSTKGGRPARDGGRPTSAKAAPAKRAAPPADDIADIAVASNAVALPSGKFCEHCEGACAHFRVQCTAVILTYNGLKSLDDWERFKAAYMAKLKEWNVLYYCATMEQCLKACLVVSEMVRMMVYNSPSSLVSSRNYIELKSNYWKPRVDLELFEVPLENWFYSPPSSLSNCLIEDPCPPPGPGENKQKALERVRNRRFPILICINLRYFGVPLFEKEHLITAIPTVHSFILAGSAAIQLAPYHHPLLILDHAQLGCSSYKLIGCKAAYHAHLMLQFRSKINKRSSDFFIETWKPNVRPSWSNLLGETMAGKRNPQPGYDRGFFYAWADKIGTARDTNGDICVHGNYPKPLQ